MRRSAVRLALVAALLHGAGASWLVVQAGAWAAMLVRRAGRMSAAEAVTTTFDGRHPCRACRFVRKAAEPDRTPTLIARAVSVDFILPTPFVFAVVPEPAPFAGPSLSILSAGPSRPAAPPPRTSVLA